MTSIPSSHDSSVQGSLSTEQGRTLQRQQVQLFGHLAQILCHLCVRIPWQQVSPSQRRRLLPLIQTLQAGLLAAEERLRQGCKPW